MIGAAQSGVIESIAARAVIVRLDVNGCPRCAAGQGCGAGRLLATRRPRSVRVATRGSRFRVGDRVVLTLPATVRRRALAMLYLLPLVALVTAGGLGALWLNDTWAAMVGLAGFAGTLLVGAAAARHLDPQVELTPCPN